MVSLKIRILGSFLLNLKPRSSQINSYLSSNTQKIRLNHNKLNPEKQKFKT
jgi:hypothetical protein